MHVAMKFSAAPAPLLKAKPIKRPSSSAGRQLIENKLIEMVNVAKHRGSSKPPKESHSLNPPVERPKTG
jgi:hypothetical protein